MTDQQILAKAITKAIENGWDGLVEWELNSDSYYVRDVESLRPDVPSIIYNKGFAKALWSDTRNTHGYDHELNDEFDCCISELHAWEFHLQQMVIAPDPIKYLGDNV